MKVVVVESPAKAKTINKYLGSDYHVLASYGHISDLPAKDGSVRPDEDFAMDWEIDPKSEKHIKDIASAMKGADSLILATDPDREGEAISWHVQRVLEARKALKGIEVKRVVFNEITKSAVLEAMKAPRDVDHELVEAYLARRALDYLVGFTLSPVLWRKLPGSRSAGRVQSVALRLICEREAAIESHVAREYWTLEADFLTPRKAKVTAQLVRLDGRKLEKFDLSDAAAAGTAEAKVNDAVFSVASIERKQSKRHPFPPFTTSTLQQEASRKLYFTSSQTMRTAQKLYEGVDIGGETVGLITYMRTDGVQMAAEAIGAARALIENNYGAPYLPSAPRLYKTKAKNAQEAHEAIRPTDLFRKPADVAPYLDKDQLRLYELIWRRTVASQMESAVLDQVAVTIDSQDRQIGLRATGSVVKFDGFLTLYKEDIDDTPEEGEENGGKILPPMDEGDAMQRESVRTLQHFTQPPPRFTEASLVKALEELGIGRPSTYASIISVLQERDYVRLEQRRFIPEDRGRVVTAFLENFFSRYVQYNFTADLENQLDEISGGRVDWKTVLRDFWKDFTAAVEGTKDLRVSEVLDTLDRVLGPHFFPDKADGHDPRSCPTCHQGRLGLRLGKFGAFIGCSNYPECRYTRQLTVASEAGAAEGGDGPRALGSDPDSGLPVAVKKGPYGHYVQLGDGEDKTTKPKRVSLPPGMDPGSLDLDRALRLLSLPRLLGPHPESGDEISAGIGRFGPYLKLGATYKSLPKGDDVLEIGMNRAVELLAGATAKARAPARSLGEHPKDGKPVTLGSGRFGPYVSHGGVYANLPKGKTEVGFEEALALIAAKLEKSGGKKPAKKAAAKKPAAKKAKA